MGRPNKNNEIPKKMHLIASSVTDNFLNELNVFADKHQISIAIIVREGAKMFMKNFKGFSEI